MSHPEDGVGVWVVVYWFLSPLVGALEKVKVVNRHKVR